MILDLKYAGHIELRTLAGDEISLIARKTRHLVRERNALCLGGDYVIVFGSAVKQRFCAGCGKLGVSEYDESADIDVFVERAERQIALEAGDIHGVGNTAALPVSSGFSLRAACRAQVFF